MTAVEPGGGLGTSQGLGGTEVMWQNDINTTPPPPHTYIYIGVAGTKP